MSVHHHKSGFGIAIPKPPFPLHLDLQLEGIIGVIGTSDVSYNTYAQGTSVTIGCLEFQVKIDYMFQTLCKCPH